MERSDACSVRAATAVPIWQATMPAKVMVVAVTYVSCMASPVPTGSPGLQPPRNEDEEEPGHHERGLDRTDEYPCADQHRPADDAFLPRAGRAVHEAGLGALASERERGEDLRSQVDRQDLHDRQWEGHGAA